MGLGFSLADGAGRITQMVRGKPDDQLGLINSPYERPSNFSCSDVNDLYGVSLDLLDLEPDIFMYSFNGRSGRFFLKQNGSVVLMENAGLKIEYDTTTYPTPKHIRRWRVTDEKGNVYYFGQNKAAIASYSIQNQSSYSGTTGSSSQNISSVSWYLIEAFDMNEENTLKYTYTLSGNQFTTFAGGFRPLSTAGLQCGGFNIIPDDGLVSTDGTEYLISRIDGNSGYVIFNSAADFTGGLKRMLSVQMYDSSNSYKGQYKFNYGSNFSSNRWRLASFSQIGSSGSDSLTHKFEYFTVSNLPPVLSTGVDIWGFFNNTPNNNTGLIPSIIYSNANVKLYWDFYANRTADPFYGQANVLTKIIYPTRGYRNLCMREIKRCRRAIFLLIIPIHLI